ncbi:hypothetical protein COK25_07320 [Bacillus cereus]|uniref:hypothetical protein n=1 Tax=Bacillus cereus TaxID=1396 RepID=UPI000BF6E422|nr:hypothetical protein [Bacillus cereus]PER14413.1 hypothetical protein CN489_04865 [Bacillus cereus]PEW62346.1 hypothetical protein CN438_00785 [Bacillus cereus]PEX41928.1 hypothetical protein CN456_25905 [Bacillus cereus]PEZ96373.1 hypothetical protein CN376_04450 [Bacillus cereus]PFF03549.1 hypothetical protein CN323_09200 [Bacillus cereus]
MYVSGVGIFEDNLSEDIKFDFQDLISEGYSSEEATEMMVNTYISSLRKHEENIFWLALAAIQWELGRLNPQVKEKAICIIESKSDLKRWWREPELKKKRELVLEKLKKNLVSPLPEPKKVKRRVVLKTELEIGDVITYRLLSGQYIILKVVGVNEYAGNAYPILMLCDWIGRNIPDKDEILTMEMKEGLNQYFQKGFQYIEVFPLKKKSYPKERIRLVYKNIEVPSRDAYPIMSMVWDEFDDDIEEYYELK